MVAMAAQQRRDARKENRKRKAVALLTIAELNDEDKKRRKNEEVDSKEEEGEIKDINTENIRLTDKPRLEGEEYEELRKRLKERKKALTCNPLFRLKSIGYDADVRRSRRVPLFMSDVQV